MLFSSQVGFELASRLQNISVADNVISIKDAPALMAADGHGHPLRHSSPHEVPHGTTPEIMEQEALIFSASLPGVRFNFLKACAGTGASPGLSKIADTLSSPEENKIAIRVFRVPFIALGCQDLQKLGNERDCSTLIVFCLPRIKTNLSIYKIDLTPS